MRGFVAGRQTRFGPDGRGVGASPDLRGEELRASFGGFSAERMRLGRGRKLNGQRLRRRRGLVFTQERKGRVQAFDLSGFNASTSRRSPARFGEISTTAS